MKLYIANGQYVGTQADAKRLGGGNGFASIEVPTDKEGLINYLNTNPAGVHQIEDPDRVVKDINDDILTTPGKIVSYTETTVKLDELVANSPLPQRLTWAALALEDARSKLAPGEERTSVWRSSGGTVEEEPVDDELFG